MTRLRDGLRGMLGAYPSTLQQNEAALAKLEAAVAAGSAEEGTSERRRRQALHVVSGEQRLLQSAIEWLEVRLVQARVDGLVV